MKRRLQKNSIEKNNTANLILKNNKWLDSNNNCNFTTKALLESISEGVIIINTESQIIYTNTKLLDMLEYQNDDLLDKNVSMLVPDISRKSHEDYIQDFFKNPDLKKISLGDNLTVKKKNGDLLAVEINLSYLEVDNKKVCLVFLKDISKRKKFETELKERNKALNAFSRMVAHDLNASLGTIVSISNLLLDKEINLKDNKKNYYIQEMAERSTKLSVVVNELLLLSRMHNKKSELEPVNIEITLKEAIKRLTVLIEKRQPKISIKPLFNCLGNSLWIEEIWLNYISNAINYGGEPCEIEIGSEIIGTKVKYWVKDNGAGISPEAREAILNSEDIEDKEFVKGHGIGLQLVKTVTDKMNGFIDISNNKNQGCTFFFYLPAIIK